jgi:hypothetical protein
MAWISSSFTIGSASKLNSMAVVSGKVSVRLACRQVQRLCGEIVEA